MQRLGPVPAELLLRVAAAAGAPSASFAEMERGPSTGHPTQPAAGTVSAADGRATAAHGDPEDPGHRASKGNLTPLHQFLNTETGHAVPWGPSPGAIVMMR